MLQVRSADGTTRYLILLSIAGLLLPAATQRPVELNQRQQFVSPGLNELEFGIEQITVGIQSAQQRVDTTGISEIGQSRSILKCCDEQLLFATNFPHLLILDQRVRHLAERCLNGALVPDQRDVLLGSCQFHICSKPASIEYRLRDLRYKLPDSGWPREKIRKLTALKTQQSRQADSREVCRFGDTNFGVCTNEFIFCQLNVRSAFQQRRRQASRHGRRLT